MKSSDSTPKNAPSSCLISPYSGYTARPASVRFWRRYSSTLGEAPTVFSLKSRRSLSARPAVGGEYGAILSAAPRGSSAPGGRSIFLLAKPHLHRPRVRFQALGTGQRRNRRRQFDQTLRREFLYRNYFHEIDRRQSPANASGARRRQDVVGT